MAQGRITGLEKFSRDNVQSLAVESAVSKNKRKADIKQATQAMLNGAAGKGGLGTFGDEPSDGPAKKSKPAGAKKPDDGGLSPAALKALDRATAMAVDSKKGKGGGGVVNKDGSEKRRLAKARKYARYWQRLPQFAPVGARPPTAAHQMSEEDLDASLAAFKDGISSAQASRTAEELFFYLFDGVEKGYSHCEATGLIPEQLALPGGLNGFGAFVRAHRAELQPESTEFVVEYEDWCHQGMWTRTAQKIVMLARAYSEGRRSVPGESVAKPVPHAVEEQPQQE
jgi:hypothetical protein